MGSPSKIALLLAVAALAACGGDSTASTTSPNTPVLRVPVGSSPVDGPADAWVTVVEFSDFECPFCARVQPTLATVLPEFGADVRLVFKNFPLSMHAHARPAAVAAECAHRQGRFWEFKDLVFAGQSALFGAPDFEAALADVAARAGLDVPAWQACRADPSAEASVIADMSLCARWGIGSTPTFVVNGTPVVGNQPASVFRAAIEKARAAARASGVPAASYYDTVIAAP
ncbi:MAG TPA: DsbA family protein [Anaeromyxobacteraceae bacterium]|nr:DsbA family protein [Anaeromyxobacteraceae bacterium]